MGGNKRDDHGHNWHVIQQRHNGIAKSIPFCVTEECNLRCTYCYMTDKNSFHRMSLDVAKQAKVTSCLRCVYANEVATSTLNLASEMQCAAAEREVELQTTMK